MFRQRLRLPLSRRFSSCVLHATVKSDNLHPKIGINLKFSLSKSSQLYPSNLYLDLDIFKYRINVFLIFLLVSTFAAAKIHADSYIKQYAKLIERPEMSKKNQSIDLRSLAKAYTSSISNNTVNQISVATNIQSIKSTIKSTKQKKIKISDISQNDDTIDSIDEPISAIAEPVIEDDDKQTVNESKTTILSTELRDTAFEMNANHKSLDNIQTADSEMERELSSSIGSYKYSNIVHGKFSTDLANDYNDDEQSYIKNIVEHSAGSVGLYPLERTTVSDVDDGCAVLDMLNKELSESHQIYTNKYYDSVFYPRSSPRPASRTMIRNTCNREYGHWSTELYGSNNRNCEDLSEPKDFNVIPETSNSSSRWKTSFGYSIPSLLKNVFENHQHHPWSRWTDVDQAPPGFQQKSSKWSIWEDKEFTE
ncbi:hypothetical protein GJ496_005149 [Pomphorhynchus laevis]|nr:hypothetical protein GJ496_005149 [Pomphorhynchus laevis]